MSAYHVPTPWVLGGSATIKAHLPGRDTPVYIATLEQGMTRAANAGFLLRAVNNHDGLVALLREADGYLDGPLCRALRNRIHNALIEADGRA